jgi:hypothetical protein
VGLNPNGGDNTVFIDQVYAFHVPGQTQNQAPTVATAASASPSTVTGTTTNLSVLGADDGGEANLTYTWALTSPPAGGGASFSVNGTNAAKNTTATFTAAGTYTFTVTITDSGGLSTTSSVTVTVSPTPTSVTIGVDPSTGQLLATIWDQFHHAMFVLPVG